MKSLFNTEVLSYVNTSRGLLCAGLYISGGLASLGLTYYFLCRTEGILCLCATAMVSFFCHGIRFSAIKMALPKKSSMALWRQVVCYFLLNVAIACLVVFLKDGLLLSPEMTSVVSLPFSVYGTTTVVAKTFLC